MDLSELPVAATLVHGAELALEPAGGVRLGVRGRGVVCGDRQRILAAQHVHVTDRLVQAGRIRVSERERRLVL